MFFECFFCYKMFWILRFVFEEESLLWSLKVCVKFCCWLDRILCILCLSFLSFLFIFLCIKLFVKIKIKLMKCKCFLKMVKMLYFCFFVILGIYRICIKGWWDWIVCCLKEKLNGSEYMRLYEILFFCLFIYFVNLN